MSALRRSGRVLVDRTGGWDLWRYEARRAGMAALAGPPALLLAGASFLALVHAVGQPVGRIAGSLLEAVLPLAAAIATASLVGADGALELQLSLPTGYRGTLARRFALVLGSCAVTSAAGSGLFALCRVWSVPTEAAAGQLAWLVPLVVLCALAAAVAAVSGSGRIAVGLVGGVWVAEEWFKAPLITPEWLRPWYLFATARADAAPYLVHDALSTTWFVNRAVLATLAVALTAVAWLALRTPGRLLMKGERE